jgi:DNA-directed RNA polymerase subunit beta'
MLRTTAGQILVNKALPPELRDYDRKLDKKTTAGLMQRIATEHPDQYRRIVQDLSNAGRDMAYASGGFSFGLRHLRRAPAARRIGAELQQEIDAILDRTDLDEDAKEAAILQASSARQKELETAVFDEAKAERNPMTSQVDSGASSAGAGGIRSLLAGDVLYTDHKGRLIPFPVLRGYAQGLKPSEYFAGAFGARKGLIEKKMGVRNSGYLAKLLSQAAHRLVVTSQDDDSSLGLGMPVDTDDSDNVGALLARDTGGYPRNTTLTPRILKELQDKGIAKLVVRSPIAGGAADGGLLARDVGVREHGRLPNRGEMAGMVGVQSITEPLSQATLSAQHSGGVAGSRPVGGFKLIESMIQIPKTFPGIATHAEADGRVVGVKEAPAGGQLVTIGGQEHYIPPGLELKVKPGDDVEAGDAISDGFPNGAVVVKYKGLGEGRRYFTQAFRQALKEAGAPANRRNVELLSRGLINHVRLLSSYGEYQPDDVVPYDVIARSWQARPGTETRKPREAVGRYLEKPVLHYSIGSKVRPSMVRQLAELGYDQIDVNSEPPPFEPEMIRGSDALQHDPDWMARTLGSGLRKTFLKGVHTGATSDAAGLSFAQSLAKAKDFGNTGPFAPGKQGGKP